MKIALIFARIVLLGYWYHINSQPSRPVIYHNPSSSYAVPLAAIALIVVGILL
jgi:hypothetical protein